MTRMSYGNETESHTLKYPEHQFDPRNLLNFVETSVFTKSWASLGLDDEDDLCALQAMLMVDPKIGSVISGTGGVRKLRFKPEKMGSGKSGAFRVCYLNLDDFGIVVLLLVYGEKQKGNLTDAEKNTIRKYVESIKRHLKEKGPFHFLTRVEQDES